MKQVRLGAKVTEMMTVLFHLSELMVGKGEGRSGHISRQTVALSASRVGSCLSEFDADGIGWSGVESLSSPLWFPSLTALKPLSLL